MNSETGQTNPINVSSGYVCVSTQPHQRHQKNMANHIASHCSTQNITLQMLPCDNHPHQHHSNLAGWKAAGVEESSESSTPVPSYARSAHRLLQSAPLTVGILGDRSSWPQMQFCHGLPRKTLRETERFTCVSRGPPQVPKSGSLGSRGGVES